MKKLIAIAISSLPLAIAPTVFAQTNTTSAPTESTAPAGNTSSAASDSIPANPSSSDKSLKDGFMGESVYNEADEKIGNITDATVSSDGQVTSLIVGAGGFLGVGEHNVAIPFDKIQKAGDKLILAGYTKDQLKELPKYESPEAKRRASEARTASPLLRAK